VAGLNFSTPATRVGNGYPLGDPHPPLGARWAAWGLTQGTGRWRPGRVHAHEGAGGRGEGAAAWPESSPGSQTL
jgi:hypothetical protein